MKPIRLGDKYYAPGKGLAAVSIERDKALQEDRASKQRFQHDVCQCCGARDRDGVTCVCDRLDWYMLPGGSVECQAHRFARAAGLGKRRFFFGRAAK